ncbi:cytochrome C [Chitinophaga silvatica]|uniref:Cytochrome C n=1 Tax=Chitinophaga silvatica TaxID=2282649 RepID=A0A3E1YGP7_9BACT|nr:c-type cytochrome domain-containing protein [Chitinophaga silvatica]RFS26546.1 cytochrome C [Chitinophaga silvatica]
MTETNGKWYRIGGKVLLATNVFVLFLVFFNSKIVLPAWIQVIGRMHPLVLHFPIVLLLLAGLLSFIRLSDSRIIALKAELLKILLLAGALFAAVTVIMGLFLSKEGGYESDALLYHKWGGVLILWLATTLYGVADRPLKSEWWIKGGTILTALLVIVTGHWGADITHGNNFVLAPVIPNKGKQVPLESAVVYADLIQPILEEKCINCHSAGKAKGGLVLSQASMLLKGGKGGKSLLAGHPDQSLLFQRLLLPEDDKKHMPPAGKPQLTETETALLYHWIKSGASFNLKAISLAASDSLRIIAASMLQSPAAEPVYDFAAADEKLVQQLNNNYRVIYPIAQHAAPLVVNCYNKNVFTSKSIEELLPLKKQIIEMHLQKMPVQDADLKLLASFKQLRTLNLSFTNIKGTTLGELAALPNLQSLSLSGTPVTVAQLQVLKKMSSLKELFIWNSGLSSNDLSTLQNQLAPINIIKGFIDDGQHPLKLNQPILLSDHLIFQGRMQLQLKHPVRGAAIHYTLDGSAPDTVNSPVFTDSILLESNTIVRAIATKSGWYASDPVQYNFARTTYVPDSIVLITKPDGSYPGSGAITLIDKQKGGAEQGNGKWLGYVKEPLEALLLFKNPAPVSNVSVGILSNVNGYIFPPTSIEIYGGADEKHLRLLKRVVPTPGKKDDPNMAMEVDCSFATTNVSCMKIVLNPVTKIPDWHPGKGNRGWVFADEVRIN